MARPRASDTQAWRRISLERQLLHPRFPAGVAAPSMVCAVTLVLLAGFAAVFLGQAGNRPVPVAVVDSQEQLADGVARSLRATAALERAELTALAEQAEPGDGDELLTAVNAGATDSSRVRVNGPTMGDVGGASLLNGGGYWAEQFLAARRI